ncbi:hypothetical protein QBC47DRAFT_368923 [Echria macrotheca]|uniref:BTB domain-containing protein n=1 Tax=Echria macrotheca TaxID=438768 RepID=A0AAJ0BNA7_9PEZI|nr:hypothetical protein QBC47DRAFT_368923 [Echria macrotheca]
MSDDGIMTTPPEFPIEDIAPTGDVVLDVKYSNGRRGYRVESSDLKKSSRYFRALLGSGFSEAKSVEEGLARLAIQGVKPSEAPADSLPHIEIEQDDVGSRVPSTYLFAAFPDLLRIVHGQAVTSVVKIRYLAALAVIADRFNCADAVSRTWASVVGNSKRTTWLQSPPPNYAPGIDSKLGLLEEEEIRQSILVSWIFNLPREMYVYTQALIRCGSRLWLLQEEEAGHQEDGAGLQEDDASLWGPWWDLPDGLEDELQRRRECIMATLASIPRHFLGLYLSRQRQCPLGSASCDSFHLGEMVKFLTRRWLVSLVDFSPNGAGHLPNAIAACASVQPNRILSILREMPGYQIDDSHKSCGPRRRMQRILDCMGFALASKSIPIDWDGWKTDRASASWFSSDAGHKVYTFRFDLHLTMDHFVNGLHGSEQLMKSMFTANEWDWTPEP